MVLVFIKVLCDNRSMQKKLSDKQREEVIEKYKNEIDARTLAKEYQVHERSILRICEKAGIQRTQRESYLIAIKQGRMKYFHKPEHLKIKRLKIKESTRFNIMMKYRFQCVLCGARARDHVRIDIDHINNDNRDNREENLQVLCASCNMGKYHNSKKYKELQETRKKFYAN